MLKSQTKDFILFCTIYDLIHLPACVREKIYNLTVSICEQIFTYYFQLQLQSFMQFFMKDRILVQLLNWVEIRSKFCSCTVQLEIFMEQNFHTFVEIGSLQIKITALGIVVE